MHIRWILFYQIQLPAILNLGQSTGDRVISNRPHTVTSALHIFFTKTIGYHLKPYRDILWSPQKTPVISTEVSFFWPFKSAIDWNRSTRLEIKISRKMCVRHIYLIRHFLCSPTQQKAIISHIFSREVRQYVNITNQRPSHKVEQITEMGCHRFFPQFSLFRWQRNTFVVINVTKIVTCFCFEKTKYLAGWHRKPVAHCLSFMKYLIFKKGYTIEKRYRLFHPD